LYFAILKPKDHQPQASIVNPIRRPFGSTALFCHPIGFGSYRILERREEHELSLRHYLAKGGNLIDTSANYGDGSSERLIGLVLKDQPREDVIVVTKGGYMQGQNLMLAKQREFPDIVRYGADLWHCIHPEFLETQLTASLERMQIDYVDGYLLHNPEYYLNHAAHYGAISDSTLDEYYRRIGLAFAYLESEVQKGRVRYYGISSNHFGFHERDRARTDLVRCRQEAAAAATTHHFAIVQLPLNVFESGGALFETNDGMCALDYCGQHGIAVLVNRPLNAFYQDHMVRLADWIHVGQSGLPDDFLDEQFHRLEEAENTYHSVFAGELFGENKQGLTEYLKRIARDIPSKDQWEMVFYQYVIPPLRQWLSLNEQRFGDRSDWNEWKLSFMQDVEDSLEYVDTYLAHSSQPESDRIRLQLYRSGYPSTDAPLSRIALHMVSQLEGVSSVLCGMRKRAYVDDAMGVMDMPPVYATKILDQFQIQIGAL